MSKKYVTLCKENDATTEYYPNIESDNIPEQAVTEEKLSSDVQAKLNKDVYTKTETNALLNDKADKSTTYTKSQVDDALSIKANASNVYTKTETDTLLNAKADASNVYTKTETDTLLSGKQSTIDSSHKLDADLVDDSTSTNKFVTSAEKSAIGTNTTAINNIKDGTTIDSFGDVESALSNKQDILVSGTNIKTINNQSLLGSGDITISGGGNTLYKHNIVITDSDYADTFSIAFNLYSLKSSKLTFAEISTLLGVSGSVGYVNTSGNVEISLITGVSDNSSISYESNNVGHVIYPNNEGVTYDIYDEIIQIS